MQQKQMKEEHTERKRWRTKIQIQMGSLILNRKIPIWLRLEVTLIIMVHTHETVFSSRSITITFR